MRSLLYARTSPEARQGFAVFAAHLVFVIMLRERLWIVWTESMRFRQTVVGKNSEFVSMRLKPASG
jgi:hypothetical protein